MPYRRTERVVRRLAEREQSILDAATALAAEGGMAAVQVAAVATRAGIAAGTVYRYFPSKTDLIAELVAAVAGRELNAMKAAADAAPGPLSALAAAIAAFAASGLGRHRRGGRCRR
jgi:AcrR family transcriptional regulator